MIPYRAGDTLTVHEKNGGVAAYEVLSNEETDERGSWSLTLRPIPSAPIPSPGLTLADALTALTGHKPAGPVADQLATYRVVPAPVEGLAAIEIDHMPCTWYKIVQFDCLLPNLLSLAFEHHLAGCRVTR